MDTFTEIAIRRAADYAKRLDCRLVAKLGFGVDGIAFRQIGNQPSKSSSIGRNTTSSMTFTYAFRKAA